MHQLTISINQILGVSTATSALLSILISALWAIYFNRIKEGQKADGEGYSGRMQYHPADLLLPFRGYPGSVPLDFKERIGKTASGMYGTGRGGRKAQISVPDAAEREALCASGHDFQLSG